MAQRRHVPAEVLVQQDMFGRGVDPLLTTQYVGNAHQVVIYDVGQVIGRQTVGLHQHLHIDLFPRDVDLATQHVLHLAGAFARHFHPYDMGLTCRNAGTHLIGAQMQAVTVIAGRLLVGHLLGAQCIQTLTGTETAEGVPLLNQLLAMLMIDGAALTLTVRTVGTADVRTFIPLQPKPAQRVENLLLGGSAGAHLVGIFDTQDKLAAVLAGKALIEQRNVGGADVRITGRGRRNAGTNSHGLSRSGVPPRRD